MMDTNEVCGVLLGRLTRPWWKFWFSRKEAAEELAKLGEPVLQSLESVMRRQDCPYCSIWATYAAAKITGIKDEQIQVLKNYLNHWRASIRGEAVSALAGFVPDCDLATSLIVDALADNDPGIRDEVIRILKNPEIKIGQNANKLLNYLDDKDRKKNEFAIEALEKLRAPELLDDLINSLIDKADNIVARSCRAWVLGSYGKIAVPHLRKLLFDENEKIIHSACHA